MNNLYVGKFQQGDQLDKNYHFIDTADTDFRDSYFNGLSIGDYVLPIKNAAITKLLKFEGYEMGESSTTARFTLVKTYSPSLLLNGNITSCKYFYPDINLLNKISKPTVKTGFFSIALEPSHPDIPDIDFYNSNRRFFICTPEKLKELSIFKPSDICVVVTDSENQTIIDIVEFSGQSFNRKEGLWNLYLEKTANGEAQYSLQELLDYADEKNDDAPKKRKYLSSVLEELTLEGIFAVDSAVRLYDNVLVGRKQYAESKEKRRKNESDASADLYDQEISEDEFYDDEVAYEDLTDYEQYAKLMAFNPNIILYGPPGTGKTFGAMRMIEAFEKQNRQSNTFSQVEEQGRVRFITFHQAFSYEEFVEGIRPELDEEGNMSYPVKAGVLREIADACRIQEQKKGEHIDALSNTTTSNEVWKVSLGKKSRHNVYTALKEKNVIAVDYNINEDISEWDEQTFSSANIPPALIALYNRINIGDLVLIFNDPRTIRMIGVVTSDYFFTDEDSFGYQHRRSVKWIANFEDSPKDIYALNQEKIMVQGSIYKLDVSISDAISLLDAPKDTKVSTQPYYLVIDEINRGNIAKIFGELITLIEKDKREVLSCTLPYSHKPFTMPKNLYLIGTMNTSDRSIALLDTALRRRFAFIEVNPDASIVERSHPTIGGNVSPAKLLQSLNNQITEKIDRDHRIGHSYFLGDDLVTKYDLFNIWYYKVLPLLMEYFYNDIKQVGDIVGKSFFDEKTGEIIQFSLKPNEAGISEFELKLMEIYEGGN